MMNDDDNGEDSDDVQYVVFQKTPNYRSRPVKAIPVNSPPEETRKDNNDPNGEDTIAKYSYNPKAQTYPMIEA